MSRKKREAEAPPSAVTGDADGFSDGWLSWLLLALFLLICLVAWWLVHRRALPGAPYAPTGVCVCARADRPVTQPDGTGLAQAFQADGTFVPRGCQLAGPRI